MRFASMLLSVMPLLAPMAPSWWMGGTEATPEVRSSAPVATYVPMGSEERAVLEVAEREASADLVYLRGGDISNSTLMTVLLVLAIVVLIVILV